MSELRLKRLRSCGMLLAASVLTLAGCSNDMDDLRAYVEEVKSDVGGRIEPLPQIKDYDSFTYDAQILRAPFTPDRPSVPLAVDSGIRPDEIRNREFLETYPLDTLRMVGTLELGPQYYGLIQTSDGLIHRVQPGNFLGQNDGKIEEITSSEIRLIEIVSDGIGGYLERDASVAISD